MLVEHARQNKKKKFEVFLIARAKKKKDDLFSRSWFRRLVLCCTMLPGLTGVCVVCVCVAHARSEEACSSPEGGCGSECFWRGCRSDGEGRV